jgi:hypothetical protein
MVPNHTTAQKLWYSVSNTRFVIRIIFSPCSFILKIRRRKQGFSDPDSVNPHLYQLCDQKQYKYTISKKVFSFLNKIKTRNFYLMTLVKGFPTLEKTSNRWKAEWIHRDAPARWWPTTQMPGRVRNPSTWKNGHIATSNKNIWKRLAVPAILCYTVHQEIQCRTTVHTEPKFIVMFHEMVVQRHNVSSQPFPPPSLYLLLH